MYLRRVNNDKDYKNIVNIIFQLHVGKIVKIGDNCHTYKLYKSSYYPGSDHMSNQYRMIPFEVCAGLEIVSRTTR